MEDQTKELSDYIDAFRRHRRSILIICTAVFVIGLAVALMWPPTYRSTATILIEEQEIPTELVRSTVTSYATQRIQVISQRVMTRANLMQVIEKYDLYQDKRRRETTEEILERMRRDINLSMINADVVDPRSGAPTRATIAFTLSFESEDARIAQKVANELTTLYLSENLKTRTEKAAETTLFLSAEADRMGNNIAELEAKLADFKRKYASRLPEQSLVNSQLMERTERDLSDVDRELRDNKDKVLFYTSQLSLMSPLGSVEGQGGERIPDPITRLKNLRSEYINLSARYSPDHPDVTRVKRLIAELEKTTGSVDSSGQQAGELARIRKELAAAREKYSEDHPDVIRLASAVALQEEALKQPAVPSPEIALAEENPQNPVYASTKSQLEATKREIEALTAKRGELKAKLDEYEKRMIQTPEVEREYLTLSRDYENAVRKYQDIKAKQLEAEVGQVLEKERKAERFSLIDPPQLPEAPIKPNRPAIIVLGFLLSVTGGFGYAVVRESIDSSVRGPKGVISALDAPPLSVIPYMKNNDDLMRAQAIKKMTVATLAGGLILVVLLAHFFWTPLDVLWFKGLRKMDTAIGG